jgi:hypothetical protein
VEELGGGGGREGYGGPAAIARTPADASAAGSILGHGTEVSALELTDFTGCASKGGGS